MRHRKHRPQWSWSKRSAMVGMRYCPPPTVGVWLLGAILRVQAIFQGRAVGLKEALDESCCGYDQSRPFRLIAEAGPCMSFQRPSATSKTLPYGLHSGSVDVIAAEDTRHTRKLLTHHGISRPLLGYHDHNEVMQTASACPVAGRQKPRPRHRCGTQVLPIRRTISCSAFAHAIPIVPIPGPTAAWPLWPFLAAYGPLCL